MIRRDILLVEDNPDDEALTHRALRRSNILNRVVVARTGDEALEYLYGDRAGELHPALILLDLNLPKMNGVEVLRRIRAEERTRLTPVVILTGSADEDDVLTCYQHGVNAYVRKPDAPSRFGEVVNVLSEFWLLVNEPPLGSADGGLPPTA